MQMLNDVRTHSSSAIIKIVPFYICPLSQLYNYCATAKSFTRCHTCCDSTLVSNNFDRAEITYKICGVYR